MMNGKISPSLILIITDPTSFTHNNIYLESLTGLLLDPTPIISPVGGVVDSIIGPIILIFHQYALVVRVTSIHSAPQLENFKINVDDRSIKVGGKQEIVTIEGIIITLSIHHSLPRMYIDNFSDDQFRNLPRIIMTNEMEWNPTIMDGPNEYVYNHNEKQQEWLSQ